MESESAKNADLKKQRKQEQKAAKVAKLEQKKQKAQLTTTQSKPKAGAKKAETYDIDTALGEKKCVTNELPKAYSPLYTEACWYAWWEKMNFFSPDYSQAGRKPATDPYVVIMPPPNVTGTLHLGHALMCAVEDAFVRWARMNNKRVLWNPGCDHAGIATQVVVERKLKKERNISRHDIGREEFVKEVWRWRDEKGITIYNQMKRLGISCDWNRAAFTMDEKLSYAVRESFIRLHEEGLIYRANRLVNWSCALKSVISDIEVDKVSVTGKTNFNVPGYDKTVVFGSICYFYYRLKDSDEKILVATTRLETMLGDTGVVVHPDDSRYKHLHGKQVLHPFCNRTIPIITDESIDTSFGTGAMKLTPAHDFNDFELGLKHNLNSICMLTDEGTICEIVDLKEDFKHFKGQKRFDMRNVLEKELKILGLFEKVEAHTLVLPVCSRSKDIIEPMLKPQWYVSCKEMAEKAVNVVKSGELTIHPKMFEKTWFSWMENLRDWCISRQLWWGHQIPAYQVIIDGQSQLHDVWVSAHTLEQAQKKAEERYNLSSGSYKLVQDEDVLDTWFSSGLFPFSVFGWPNESDDLATYYPTTLMETGHDILFFWVARMVMLGWKLTGKIPFKDIFLHALIRDGHGRKMSKSLGNIVDPINVITGISLQGLNETLKAYNLEEKELKKAIESQKIDYPNGIPECGADALRFALCAYTCQSKDINLDVLRIQGYRFFCNKIWNAVKFLLYYCKTDVFEVSIGSVAEERHIERWILSRLDFCISQCEKSFKEYNLQLGTSAVYNFWLYDLCDIYIEAIKPSLPDDKIALHVLLYCVHNGLKLLSPYMPFISEELYQRLPIPQSEFEMYPSIIVSTFPLNNDNRSVELEEKIENIMNIVRSIRSTKERFMKSKAKTEAIILTVDDEHSNCIKPFNGLIKTLANLSNVACVTGEASMSDKIYVESIVSSAVSVRVEIESIDDIESEISNQEEKLAKLRGFLVKTSQSVEQFDESVTEEIRTKTLQKQADLTAEINSIIKFISDLALKKTKN